MKCYSSKAIPVINRLSSSALEHDAGRHTPNDHPITAPKSETIGWSNLHITLLTWYLARSVLHIWLECHVNVDPGLFVKFYLDEKSPNVLEVISFEWSIPSSQLSIDLNTFREMSSKVDVALENGLVEFSSRIAHLKCRVWMYKLFLKFAHLASKLVQRTQGTRKFPDELSSEHPYPEDLLV